MTARSDARKRREEPEPRDQAVVALQFLADAVAAAVRAGVISEPLTQANHGLILPFRSFERLGEFYAELDTRLEPF